jgi:hypothetical protein
VFHSTLTICVGHKIVESIVYATMGPLEFLMMSPSFQDDGDNYNVICLLFIMINVSEIIQKRSTVSGGEFHVQVICGGLYTIFFGILTHKFVILYGFKNIE